MNADETNLPDFPLGTDTPDEPGSLSRWVPWAVVLICALGYRGCLFVDEHGAGFDGKIHGPWKSTAQIAIANPPKDEDPLFKEGKNVYTTFCAPCHQPSGLGAPGIAPPLVGSEWVLAEGANRIIRIVLNGAQGPITVKGQEFNLAMVPWKDALNDKQIAAVITFIRNNPEWEHKAGGVKPEEVAPIRKATADKASAYTAPELLAVPVK
ncbi:MAG: cytochrome c [Verrucomicrobia bacterium]|nr:cytochrome c [Verrucomicrobiota bacterium]